MYSTMNVYDDAQFSMLHALASIHVSGLSAILRYYRIY